MRIPFHRLAIAAVLVLAATAVPVSANGEITGGLTFRFGK